jgi:hypothetical protein
MVVLEVLQLPDDCAVVLVFLLPWPFCWRNVYPSR